MTAARSRRPSAFSVALTALAVLLLYLAVPNIGTVIRAARADGAPGVNTPVRLSCVQHPGHESCFWSGEFRSDDGTIVRQDVEMYGSDRYTNREGEQVPAVDIGLAHRVYGPGGSNEWVFTALLLLAGLAILVKLYGGAVRGLLARPERVPG